MGLSEANKARLDKELDKLYRSTDGIVYSLRERLSAGFYKSVEIETKTMSDKKELRQGKLQYWPLKRAQVSYFLEKSDGSGSIQVCKLVADYAKENTGLLISSNMVQKVF